MDALPEALPLYRRPRVLVVDDNSMVRTLIATVLGRRGYDVIAVDSGEAAIDACQNVVELVVLDLTLPGMSGLAVCRELRSMTGTHALPIVVLTGRVERNDVRDAIRAGADAYLAKPFDTGDLLSIVERLRPLNVT